MAAKKDDGLQSIPGVGPSIARDLRALGYHSVRDLRNADPEEMYARLIRIRARHQDRCVLYVFRCAAYFASTSDAARDPELLKWWSWKDRAFTPSAR